MATLTHKKENRPPQDSFAARQLARGLTLVPYRFIKDGVRIPGCQWVRLRPGETLSDAAQRLTREVGG